ncbi:MAG: cation-translocating P-type ATPase C-terminal domain-containing protein [Hyphomicrobiales bacterium]
MAGLPLPLLPLQILFLNLVTDIFPAFALATGEGERDVLRRPPRDPRESLLARPQWIFIVTYGAVLTAATLGALLIGSLVLELEGEALVTVSFLTLAFAQLAHVLNMRGRGASVFVNAVTTNPYVWLALIFCAGLLVGAVYAPPIANALQITAPDQAGWMLVAGASLMPLVLGIIFSAARAILGRKSRE